MPPQALIRFPGIQQVIQWSYTLSHGITPGVASVEIVPQEGVPAEVGTLQIMFGQARILFPECVVDHATVRRTTSGMVVGLSILDRRWMWRFGEINGRYNLRQPDGRVVRDTEKSPQELATLLMRAMGESDFAVVELPNLVRPEVDWVYANPAQELAALAESLGCRVVLGTDNRVALRRIGEGSGLPDLGVQRTENFGIDPPARPDSLRLVCGLTRWQSKFRLEAVGEDRDGSIRLIGDLKYKPADGWGYESFFGFGNVADNDDRARVNNTVFRWYRIKCHSPYSDQNRFLLPEFTDVLRDLWQVLPIEGALVETYVDKDNVSRPRPAVVEGIFWNQSPDGDNVTAVRKYTGGFEIDRERGIVRFFDPVVKRNSDDTVAEAELYLMVGHPAKGPTFRQDSRYTMERRLGGATYKTGPHVIHRDDIAKTVIVNYGGTNNLIPQAPTLNTARINREINNSLDAAEAEFATRESADIEYAGIVDISPDGAIQQVGWQAALPR